MARGWGGLPAYVGCVLFRVRVIPVFVIRNYIGGDPVSRHDVRQEKLATRRKPARELTFPEWVKSSPCKVITSSHIVPTPHGVIRVFITDDVQW